MKKIDVNPIASFLQRVALLLLFLFAGFWLLFGIASHWAEEFSAAGLPSIFMRGSVIVLLVVITCRW